MGSLPHPGQLAMDQSARPQVFPVVVAHIVLLLFVSGKMHVCTHLDAPNMVL